MMFLRHTYGGHGPCARYAFRKRTSQRVGCSARLARASIQPDDDDGAAPGARSPARDDDAPAPRPCMHAAAARVPPPARGGTAQHSTARDGEWCVHASVVVVVVARFILSLFSETPPQSGAAAPRLSERRTQCKDWTCAWKTTRADPSWGPEASAVGWGGLGDDERRLSLRWLARAQCQWTGGAARARPRRVGVTAMGEWATAQARRQVTSWSRSRGPYVGPPGRLLFTPYIYTSFL
jgi:hypothetical protein